MDYSWPGNVRELQNAVDHALVAATGNEISIADLPTDLRLEREVPMSTEDHADRDRIHTALTETGWNRTRAAIVLGMSRVTLWKKMRRFNLGPDRVPESTAKVSV